VGNKSLLGNARTKVGENPKVRSDNHRNLDLPGCSPDSILLGHTPVVPPLGLPLSLLILSCTPLWVLLWFLLWVFCHVVLLIYLRYYLID